MSHKSGAAHGGVIPLLAKEGWTRHQKNIAKPPLKGADGVVAFAKMFREGIPKRFVVSDHPVCGALVGFAEIFLMPQPPLLRKPSEGGE